MKHSLVPVKGKVLHCRTLLPGYYELSLCAPSVVARAHPGQFVAVRVGQGLDPLLRRPLSLSSWDHHTGTLALWVERVGRGTRALEELKPGDEVDLLGPLGRGFPPVSSQDELVVVGGGIGVAPLRQLVVEAQKATEKIVVCLGARSRSHLLGVEELSGVGVRVEVATDDGSRGHHGLVTELMEKELKPGLTRIMACGPWPMLNSVQKIATRLECEAYVSLEAYMACAVGACQGCAVKAGDKDGYHRVCADGPVFSHAQIAWETPGEGWS